MRDFVLTSESVTAGHPDKLCDQISDAMVDSCLSADPQLGCVTECAIASGVAFLSLRHSGTLTFDPVALARRVLAEAGYAQDGAPSPTTVMLDTVEAPALTGPQPGIPARANRMTTAFGYACEQTPALMPWPIWAAHQIGTGLDALMREPDASGLWPDAQVQVAVRFEARRPVEITGIALTLCTDAPGHSEAALRELIEARVIEPAFAGSALRPDAGTRLVIQRIAARGGPAAHSGLTGRKVGDDCYGGYVRQSSSALSGKDPGRIDRIAAYAARQGAVSVVAAGLARECEVQLSFVAGDVRPISLETDSFGSGRIPDTEISALLSNRIDFSVSAIAERLALWDLPRRNGGRFYQRLACHGHFGRADLDLPWDRALSLA